jgi:hypothetical protein
MPLRHQRPSLIPDRSEDDAGLCGKEFATGGANGDGTIFVISLANERRGMA